MLHSLSCCSQLILISHQARGSRDCRSSPARATPGPRNSRPPCRCGWWRGTGAKRTLALSASPHIGGTQRRFLLLPQHPRLRPGPASAEPRKTPPPSSLPSCLLALLSVCLSLVSFLCVRLSGFLCRVQSSMNCRTDAWARVLTICLDAGTRVKSRTCSAKITHAQLVNAHGATPAGAWLL